MMGSDKSQVKIRSLHPISWLMILTISGILFAKQLPLRINLTSSMPQGIYLLTSSKQLRKGDFVEVCLDKSLTNFALQRGYLHSGSCPNKTQSLLKQVVAQINDKVALTTSSVNVNGRELPHSITLSYDKHGRPLPSIQRGVYFLLPHQIWLYGIESERSWDSRYFGAVDALHVLKVAKPLLIWSEEK